MDLNALVAAHTPIATGPDHLDYILVDGSSSMMDKWWNFLTAADVILDDLRKTQLNPHVIVQVFDSENLASIQRDMPLAACPTFKDAPLGANFAMTPLYDAINLMGYRLSKIMPAKASILVITDGADNVSMMHVLQARAVLDWCRANGWAITFIGADFNNSVQAKELGVNESNAIGVTTAKLGDAAKNFAAKRIAYAHGTRDGISFTDDERKQFGGYLK